MINPDGKRMSDTDVKALYEIYKRNGAPSILLILSNALGREGDSESSIFGELISDVSLQAPNIESHNIPAIEAFLLGLGEFRSATTTHYEEPLIDIYDSARRLAHEMTFSEFEE